MLGASDTGKSYLLERLAERLAGAGRRVAMIDADPGQSRIGPPTTIGLQLPYRPGGAADAMYFVGSVSPPRHLLPMLSGLAVLAEQAGRGGAESILIDTPGFLDGPAAGALWQSVIDVLHSAVVLVEPRQTGGAAGPSWLEGVELGLRLRADAAVVRRSREQRQSYRAQAFRRYFSQSREICLDAARVVVRWLDGAGAGRVLQPGQLVSLRDRDRIDLALGLVVEQDGYGGRLRLRSVLVEPQAVCSVVGSGLRIRPDDWREEPLP